MGLTAENAGLAGENPVARCLLGNPAMTTGIVKIKRSAVYHLLNTIAPSNHKLKANLDILGSIVIVLLALGIVTFARLILFSGQ
jgi:hypothetical protein